MTFSVSMRLLAWLDERLVSGQLATVKGEFGRAERNDEVPVQTSNVHIMHVPAQQNKELAENKWRRTFTNLGHERGRLRSIVLYYTDTVSSVGSRAPMFSEWTMPVYPPIYLGVDSEQA